MRLHRTCYEGSTAAPLQGTFEEGPPCWMNPDAKWRGFSRVPAAPVCDTPPEYMTNSPLRPPARHAMPPQAEEPVLAFRLDLYLPGGRRWDLHCHWGLARKAAVQLSASAPHRSQPAAPRAKLPWG